MASLGESVRVRLNRDLQARLRLVAIARQLGVSATIRALLKERLEEVEKFNDPTRPTPADVAVVEEVMRRG